MDTRLGHPSEHLAGNNSIDISSPMYATAVGLVMNSTKINKKSNIKEDTDNNELEEIDDTIQSERLTIFEQFTEKIKTFLDNAE
jgi:cell division protein FtsA